ncbi:hypothetical protein ONZ45_g5088 [Pleurotus djamor]|nr:hypothetical protein ONZ45_g5088 [Pleurotus djamor]
MSYEKDVDISPPSDSKIHRVDPTSTNAEKPHEPHNPVKPPTKAQEGGVKASTKEGAYDSVDKEKPYDMPGKDRRYGGIPE